MKPSWKRIDKDVPTKSLQGLSQFSQANLFKLVASRLIDEFAAHECLTILFPAIYADRSPPPPSDTLDREQRVRELAERVQNNVGLWNPRDAFNCKSKRGHAQGLHRSRAFSLRYGKNRGRPCGEEDDPGFEDVVRELES